MVMGPISSSTANATYFGHSISAELNAIGVNADVYSN